MKKLSYLTLILSLSILAACTPPLPTTNTPKDDTSVITDSENKPTEPRPTDTEANDSAQPDQPFSLAIGESMIFQPAGLTIEFVEVKSDSRCPSDVVCVWAGEATVHIKSTTQGPAVEADLIIPGTEKNQIQLKGDVGSAYNLKLLDLTPYPNSKNPTVDKQYQATFVFQAA